VARDGEPTVSVRVQMPEAWDVVRFVASPTTPVSTLKLRALEELAPGSRYPDDFVFKLRGWEVLDERAPLAEVGVQDGSILLLISRRKRPVRRGG
jgi:hypothetical protein